MNGVQLLELDLNSMLDVTYALMVDDQIVQAKIQVAEDRVTLYHRARARADVEEMLDEAAPSSEAVGGRDWGLRPEHQASMAAAMAAIGPPAGIPGGSA